MKTHVGILDCNNFFVSCERLFRPDLKDKPVVTLSSNDGCVVARSQEVKDAGVPMGVPYFKVKDILKDIETTTFSSNFVLYRDISRRVFEVMRQELDTVEQYSIDEAFFNIEGKQQDVTRKAQALKDKVEQLVGIPVSIGIASSKTQAKFANTIAKNTTGIKLLDVKEWNELTPSIALAEIWGVGYRMSQRYKQHNLETVADFLSVEEDRIARIFGVHGLRLLHELRGVPSVVNATRQVTQKSLMSSRSFCNSSSEKTVLSDALAYHIRHVAADLRAIKMKANSLTVSIRPSGYGDFALQGGSLQVDLLGPTNDSFELLRVANELLTSLFVPGTPYKKLGVTVADFVPEMHTQYSLFTNTLSMNDNDLMSVIDSINRVADKELIKVGSHLKTEIWQARKDVRSPAYTTRWSEVATAKAV